MLAEIKPVKKARMAQFEWVTKRKNIVASTNQTWAAPGGNEYGAYGMGAYGGVVWHAIAADHFTFSLTNRDPV